VILDFEQINQWISPRFAAGKESDSMRRSLLEAKIFKSPADFPPQGVHVGEGIPLCHRPVPPLLFS
jgi:hypothetical protein